MRRFMRWLRQLLTGRKEEHGGLDASRHVGSDAGPEKERKRWSFSKQRRSGADGGGGGGGARPSSGQDAGAVAPTAAAAVVEWPQPVKPREDARAREHRAAIVVQKTFRGYLARRALRALRSLVKIQARVRGYLVRKQAAMTLHRLQTLMRLQADSIAVKKASYRKSMEQEERIFARDVQMKPPSTPVHRRGLSDSTDSNYERSPRIVEMDTCNLRSRSSRITSRYNAEYHLPEYHRHAQAAPTPSCSPLPGGKHHQPARLSLRQSTRERDPEGSKTAQTTPRFASHGSSSPAKSVEHSLAGTPRRRAAPRDRDALVSPRYMAGTASSAARTRCHSAPRQRLATDGEQALRTSGGREGAPSRRSCSLAYSGALCLQCAYATRTAGFSGISVSDEVARDYYLDSFW